MNEANMSAPTLITLDLPGLVPAGSSLPEDVEVHVMLPEITDGFPQFTSADSSVKVDNG